MDDHERLIRIDEKMDTVLLWEREHTEHCHTMHRQYEQDIKELQVWRWKWAGITAAVVFLLNIIGYQAAMRGIARELLGYVVKTVPEFPGKL